MTHDTRSQGACCCGGGGTVAVDPAPHGADAAHPSSDAASASKDAYSVVDDRYSGPRQKVPVDFLYLDVSCCDRCQGADKRVEAAVNRCKDVLDACGYELVFNPVHVDSPELAIRYRFESSPTIRVNGIDICPSVEENDCECCSDMSDALVTCRIFPFNGTYYEVPPTDMVVQEIMKVVFGDKAPRAAAGDSDAAGLSDSPADSEPFELPQNLIRFYEGVANKARKCCC